MRKFLGAAAELYADEGIVVGEEQCVVAGQTQIEVGEIAKTPALPRPSGGQSRSCWSCWQ